jgi:hypothetical protein
VNRASDDLHKVAAVLRDRMASMPEGSTAHAVPDEEVSALQTSLSSLKGEYKGARDALAAAHACVEAASIAENGARRRLITCFEAWLAVEGPLLALVRVACGDYPPTPSPPALLFFSATMSYQSVCNQFGHAQYLGLFGIAATQLCCVLRGCKK